MLRDKLAKQISIIVILTLIIGLMGAFVLPKNTKAQEETTVAQQVTTVPETTEPETTKPVDPDEYELVAHRGLSSEAPENSKPALERAVAAGYQHIELDIRRCKENSEGEADWVIIHDEDLSRLCGVNKKIADMTVNEIKKYSYKTGSNVDRYPNLKILSLEELIDYIKEVKDKGITVDWRIELKKLANTEEKEQIDEEVVKPLKEAEVDDCVTFISFYYSNLTHVVEKNPEMKICYLAKILSEEYLDYAISLRDDYNANISTLIFRGTTYTTDEAEMRAAMDEGFKLGVYALDSIVMMGSYYSMGVRSFTTNSVKPANLNVSILKKKYNIKDFNFSLSKKNYTFTNSRKKPKFTVKYDDQELLEGLCYETSYSNNRYPGDATATATGLRNVSGEKDKAFTIKMPKVKGFKIKNSKSTSIKYTWTANTDVKGYKIYKYNYKTKKYKLVKTIKKNTTNKYTASKLTTATKYRYRVRTYFTYKKKTYKSAACTGKTTYTNPATENKIKMKRYKKGKKVKITFGKLPRVTGYTVKLSTSKNFVGNVKTITVRASKNSLKTKVAFKKKTYYAKVRGYLKVGSKKYYGSYSKVVKKKGYKAKKKNKKKAA